VFDEFCKSLVFVEGKILVKFYSFS
jgi:hypothetical protein